MLGYSESTSSSSDFEFDGGDEPEKYTCVVCTNILDTVESFFNHLEISHGWNISENIDTFSDQYSWIAFVNWARSTKPTDWKLFLSLSKDEKQKFLQPVLQDDDVLMIDTESMGTQLDVVASTSAFNEPKTMDQLMAENEELRYQLIKCRQLLVSAIDESAAPLKEYGDAIDLVGDRIVAGTSATDRQMVIFHSPLSTVNAIVDSVYTMAFRKFIMHNARECFAGKVVLNLCAGSNPLIPIFLAHAGVSRIFAIESSPQMSQILRQTAKSNGFDKIIHILEGKLNVHQESSLCIVGNSQTNDTIVTLPVDKVDAIVCDWMSPLLMLQRPNLLAVIEASAAVSHTRIYPRHASIHFVAAECSRDGLLRHLVDFDPSTTHRFDLSYLSTLARSLVYSLDMSRAVKEGRVRLISTPSNKPIFPPLDLLHSPPRSCTTAADFHLTISSLDGTLSPELNALIAYFDCSMDEDAKFKIGFTTSPAAQSTHYLQTVFFLPTPIRVSSGDRITGSVRIEEEQKPGMSRVHITLSHPGLSESIQATYQLAE